MAPSISKGLLILITCLLTAGCGPSEKELQAARAAHDLKEERARQEKREKVAAQFRSLSDKEIAGLLSDCKREVMAAAREQYKPFEPFMVDEYSADRLQVNTQLAGGRISTEGDFARRVKDYRARLNEDKAKGGHAQNYLDTRFSVMVTRDTFNGPERMNVNATCEFDVGPKALAVLARR